MLVKPFLSFLGNLSDAVAEIPGALRRVRQFPRSPFFDRFQKGFTPSFQILWRRHKWLTQQVPSLHQIRWRRRNGLEPLSDRFQEALHKIYSLKRSVLAAGLLLGTSMIVSITGAILLSSNGFEADSGLPGTLLTVAETLGGIAGILIAVVVFGLQFHGERLGEASFLVRYLGRREGLVPIAALSLAVVTSNLLIALLASLWLPHAAKVMAVLDLILGPAVLGLTLWLFYRMVVSVSGDFFLEGLLPGLTWEYSRAMDEEVLSGLLGKRFREELEKRGCKYDALYGMPIFDTSKAIGLGRLGSGSIQDIDLAILCPLLDELNNSFPELGLSLTAGPGDAVNGAPVLWLIPSHVVFGKPQPQEIVIPQCLREAAERKLHRAYLIGPGSENELPDVLRRFSGVLVAQAAHDKPDQFRRGLDVLEQLIRLRVLRADADMLTPGLHALPDYLGNYEYHDMAKAVAASGDEAKADALLVFASRVAHIGKDANCVELFVRGTQVIELMYYFGICVERLAPSIATLVDSSIHSVTTSFFRSTNEFGGPNDPKFQSFRIASIKWVLELLKAAAELNRSQDASDFLDRLEQFPDRYARQPDDAAAEALGDSVVYAKILLLGWCLKLLTETDVAKEAATTLARRIAGSSVRQAELMRVWETTPQAQEGGYLLQARHWDFSRRRFRSGIPSTTFGHAGWPLNGLIAWMLARHKASGILRRDDLGGSPSLPPHDDQSVKALAGPLLAAPLVQKQALMIEDGEKGAALESVRQLFAHRRRLFKLAELRRVVEATVSQEKVEALRAELSEEIAKERCPWIKALSRPETGLIAADKVHWPPPMCWVKSWKELFISNPKYVGNWTGIRAEQLCWREEMQQIWQAENVAAPSGTISELAVLQDELRRIMGELRAKGFNPTMILLPKQERFSFALFHKLDWQVTSRQGGVSGRLGQWEGCDVFRFPYTNCQSALVIDPKRFFGLNDLDGADAVQMLVTDNDRAGHMRVLVAAEQESDETKVPTPNDIHVDFKAYLRPTLGISDTKAAAKLELGLKTLGYAMRKEENVYHRPGCEHLIGDADEYSLAPHMTDESEPRRPCEHCRPNDWDDAPSLPEGGIKNGEIHRPCPPS